MTDTTAVAPDATGAGGAPEVSADLGTRRSPGLVIFLTIVTLGLWALVWSYRTGNDLKRYRGSGVGGVGYLLLTLLVWPVTMFLLPGEIQKLYTDEGKKSPISPLWGLWFLLPIAGPIVWFLRTQRSLNGYWTSVGQANDPVKGVLPFMPERPGGYPMVVFIVRRLLLALVTLAILLVIVTLIPNIAPGDPARKIAGGTASPERLIEVTESLGLRDGVFTQLWNLAKSVFTLDFGESFSVATGEPVMSLVWTALWNSFKLVLFSLIVMVPLSILGGLVAAYKKDTWIDRSIVNTGLALSAIPDFVAGVFLLAFLAVPFDFFKVQATAPPGSGILTQMQHLLLPVLAVLMVYFGYIARVTRAGTITALESDYARTAFMRGLTTREVFRKHIARNALQPTVAVLGTQLGYLFGGMVALEVVFGYQGIGNLIIRAVDRADYPVLRAGVLTVAIIYMLATLAADLLIAWMNPRARAAFGEAS